MNVTEDTQQWIASAERDREAVQILTELTENERRQFVHFCVSYQLDPFKGDIGDIGTIVAYHAAFEKRVIRDLARVVP